MFPSYLNDIGKEISYKNYKSHIRIICNCGCDEFYYYKNDNNLEKNLSNDLLKKYGKKFEIQSDKNGIVYIVKRNVFGIITKKEMLDNSFNTTFNNFLSVRCSKCEKEYIIFNQKIHGYDSCCVNNSNDNKIETSNFVNKINNIEIDFYYNSELIEDASIKDKTLAFDRIKVIGECDNAKKKIIDVECS